MAIKQSNNPDSDYWKAMDRYFSDSDLESPASKAAVNWAILGPLVGYITLFICMKIWTVCVFPHTAALAKRSAATVEERRHGSEATTMAVDANALHAGYYSKEYVTREDQIAKAFAVAAQTMHEGHGGTQELYTDSAEFLGLVEELHSMHR